MVPSPSGLGKVAFTVPFSFHRSSVRGASCFIGSFFFTFHIFFSLAFSSPKLISLSQALSFPPPRLFFHALFQVVPYRESDVTLLQGISADARAFFLLTRPFLLSRVSPFLILFSAPPVFWFPKTLSLTDFFGYPTLHPIPSLCFPSQF